MGAVIGLSASHLGLVVLLLSLNLRSDWPWLVKAGAIAVTLGFCVSAFVALEAICSAGRRLRRHPASSSSMLR